MVKWIEPELYNHIREIMPVFCVDVVVLNELGEVLLLKRNNEPCRGEFWVCGGRVLKSESMRDAARRKLLEETGIDSAVITSYIGIIDGFFDEVHTPVVIFVARVNMPLVRLDSQHSSYRWVGMENITIANGYHKYLVGEIELVSQWLGR